MIKTARYQHGIPSDVQFVKVTGEDGVFYDLTNKHEAKEHIIALKNEGFEAIKINRTEVPPCTYRNFTDSLDRYTEDVLENGTEFYFED